MIHFGQYKRKEEIARDNCSYIDKKSISDTHSVFKFNFYERFSEFFPLKTQVSLEIMAIFVCYLIKYMIKFVEEF